MFFYTFFPPFFFFFWCVFFLFLLFSPILSPGMPLAAALTDPGLVAGAGDIIPEPTGGYGGAVLTVLAHVVGFTFPPKSALGVGGGGGAQFGWKAQHLETGWVLWVWGSLRRVFGMKMVQPQPRYISSSLRGKDFWDPRLTRLSSTSDFPFSAPTARRHLSASSQIPHMRNGNKK